MEIINFLLLLIYIHLQNYCQISSYFSIMLSALLVSFYLFIIFSEKFACILVEHA